MYSTVKYLSALLLIFIWVQKRCDAAKFCARQLTVKDDGSTAWQSIGDCDEEDEKASAILSKWNSEYERSEERKSTNAPQSTADTTQPKTQPGLCQVKSMNRCFWLEVHDPRVVNFSRAEEICRSKASEPAFISDETTYNLLMNHIRANMPSGWTWTNVWTGIRYDPTSGTAAAKNGMDPYLQWSSLYPLEGLSYNRVSLIVNSDPGNTQQGMSNWPRYQNLYGVICETGNQDV